MVRFHRGNPKTGRHADPAEAVAELNAMTDYVEMGDRDAIHLIEMMNFDRAAFARGLEAQKITLAAVKILRMIKLGQGKEFSRSPVGPTDNGMDPFEVEARLGELTELAVHAEINGRNRVTVLIFDEDMITPKK